MVQIVVVAQLAVAVASSVVADIPWVDTVPQAPSIADPALSKERLLRIDILLGLGRSACLKAGRGRICVVSSAAHQQYCTIGRRLHGCGVPHTIWRCVNELLMLWVYGYLDVLLWHIGI